MIRLAPGKMIGLHNDKYELRMSTPKFLFGKKDKKS